MLDSSNIWLLFNILFWLSLYCSYKIKHNHFGASGFLLSLFIFFSISSLLVYNDPFWGERFKSLSLFPFLILDFLIIVSLLPVFKWDNENIKKIESNNLKAVYVVCGFFIICTFFRVGDLTELGSGFMKMMVSSEAGADVYIETMLESEANQGSLSINNIFAIFSNLLYDISVFSFFFLLHKKSCGHKFKICMILSILICIIIPITQSQRGPVLERVLVLVVSFFAFDRFLGEKIVATIKKYFIILGFILSIPIVLITISRFEDRGTLGSVFFYFGQQNLFFNNFAFDNNGLRYGDRVFPVFKKFLGFENVPLDFWTRRIKYQNLYINDEVFIGYVGDFMLDFGPIITIIIFILFSWYVYHKIKVTNGVVYLHNMLPLLFTLHVCAYGGLFLFPFADTDNYTIIMYILVYYFYKYYKIG